MYKGVSVNVDFYSGFVYNMLGLPTELYTPIFAIARMVGWSAHRMEELANNGKIIRPAYKTVCQEKEYVSLAAVSYTHLAQISHLLPGCSQSGRFLFRRRNGDFIIIPKTAEGIRFQAAVARGVRLPQSQQLCPRAETEQGLDTVGPVLCAHLPPACLLYTSTA